MIVEKVAFRVEELIVRIRKGQTVPGNRTIEEGSKGHRQAIFNSGCSSRIVFLGRDLAYLPEEFLHIG